MLQMSRACAQPAQPRECERAMRQLSDTVQRKYFARVVSAATPDPASRRKCGTKTAVVSMHVGTKDMNGESRRHSYVDVLERVSDGVHVDIIRGRKDSSGHGRADDRPRRRSRRRSSDRPGKQSRD